MNIRDRFNLIGNVRKMLLGRQEWRADSEFAYYTVTPDGIREAARRQIEFAQSGYLVGVQIAHAMGLHGHDSVLGRDVLDIGSGECLLGGALRVACRARSVWAIDAVPRQLWAAARYHVAEGEAYQFIIANATSLPFEDRSFDVVTANLVMHHIEPLEPVLLEAHRVLRRGGVFTCSEPAPVLGMLFHEQGSDNEAPVPPTRLVRELGRAGFDEVTWKYSWVRFNTSALGPLSPGYTIKARKSGRLGAQASAPALARAPVPAPLPNLLLDAGCAHLSRAVAQCEQIAAALDAAVTPTV